MGKLSFSNREGNTALLELPPFPHTHLYAWRKKDSKAGSQQ